MPLQDPAGLEGFRQMEHLPERLALFERHLNEVPCEGIEALRCEFQSNIAKMCPVCQIKMFFVHTVLNWDAYHPGRTGFVGSFTE